jgi:epoxide hydrolase 4
MVTSCHSHFAYNGSVRLHYVVAGSGPTVVLLHGIPDFWNGWRYQIRHLSDSYRVVAIDLRGFNESGQPPGLAAYAMRELVGDVLAVLRHLGESRVSLVGHDWGGIIAWWTAIFFAQHVDRLFVLSAPHPLGYLAALRDGSQVAHTGYFEKLLNAPIGAPLDIPQYSRWVKDPAARSELEGALSRSNPESIRNYYRANLPNQHISDVPEDACVRIPTFVMYGDADPYVTPLAYAKTGEYVTGKLCTLIMPGYGHFLHHEAADRVNEELTRWLEDSRLKQ